MANPKATIQEIPLTGAININTLKTDISQYTGYNDKNTTLFGSTLSPLYDKATELSDLGSYSFFNSNSDTYTLESGPLPTGLGTGTFSLFKNGNNVGTYTGLANVLEIKGLPIDGEVISAYQTLFRNGTINYGIMQLAIVKKSNGTKIYYRLANCDTDPELQNTVEIEEINNLAWIEVENTAEAISYDVALIVSNLDNSGISALNNIARGTVHIVLAKKSSGNLYTNYIKLKYENGALVKDYGVTGSLSDVGTDTYNPMIITGVISNNVYFQVINRYGIIEDDDLKCYRIKADTDKTSTWSFNNTIYINSTSYESDSTGLVVNLYNFCPIYDVMSHSILRGASVKSHNISQFYDEIISDYTSIPQTPYTSASSYLENLLRTDFYSVGDFVSPHSISFSGSSVTGGHFTGYSTKEAVGKDTQYIDHITGNSIFQYSEGHLLNISLNNTIAAATIGSYNSDIVNFGLIGHMYASNYCFKNNGKWYNIFFDSYFLNGYYKGGEKILRQSFKNIVIDNRYIVTSSGIIDTNIDEILEDTRKYGIIDTRTPYVNYTQVNKILPKLQYKPILRIGEVFYSGVTSSNISSYGNYTAGKLPSTDLVITNTASDSQRFSGSIIGVVIEINGTSWLFKKDTTSTPYSYYGVTGYSIESNAVSWTLNPTAVSDAGLLALLEAAPENTIYSYSAIQVGNSFTDDGATGIGKLPDSASNVYNSSVALFACGTNAGYQVNNNKFIGYLPNPYLMPNFPIFPDNTDDYITYSPSTDKYLQAYLSIGDTVTVPIYKGQNDALYGGTFYPINTTGNIMIPLNYLSKIIEGYGTNNYVINGNITYQLTTFNINSYLYSYYYYTGMENVNGIFTLQGQSYTIDDKLIYSVSYANNVVADIRSVAYKKNLRYLGVLPSMAVFWSDFNKSFYMFTGDAMVNKLQEASDINEIYYVAQNPGTLSLWVCTDKGIYVFTDSDQFRLDYISDQIDFREDKAIIVAKELVEDEEKYIRHDISLYDLNNEAELVPVKLVTKYYGPGSEMKVTIDCWYIRLTSEDLREGYLKVKVNTITDVSKESVVKEYSFNKSDYDDNGVIYIKYQPQLQANVGMQLELETNLDLYELSAGINANDAVAQMSHINF